ncbi:Cys-Gln thioester bond-forming surface protein [Streptomyces sp. ZYX-F-203]
MFLSFSVRSAARRAVVRLASATTVSVLTVTAFGAAGGKAVADGGPGGATAEGGATATLDGLKTHGRAVIHGESGDRRVSAGLFEMSVAGGGTLRTYCVDAHNPTQQGAEYHETPWSGTSLGVNERAGRIRWILLNSYPQVDDLAALAEKAGVRGAFTEEDAAAGTQVALWRLSDAIDVEAVDPQAERLADYLVGEARDSGEPRASLTLDPPAVSGRAGAPIGPVTVRTDADRVTVAPPSDAATSGVRVVDEAGEPVTSAADGSRLFFDVPEDAVDGRTTLTVRASTTVPVGRAFASESGSQTQILAGSSESAVSAAAEATWAGEGAAPAISATENCAEEGLEVTVANGGDETFSFELSGTEYSVEAGAARTVSVPLAEDSSYDVTVYGPDGSERRFTGVLDCRTQGDPTESDPTDGEMTRTLGEPGPAAAGGGALPDADLAATGGSEVTPLIGAIALVLLVLGGGTLLVVRRRGPAVRD